MLVDATKFGWGRTGNQFGSGGLRVRLNCVAFGVVERSHERVLRSSQKWV
jgi:hypothetical protein